MKNFVHQIVRQSLLFTASIIVSLPVFANSDPTKGGPVKGEGATVTYCDCPNNLVQNPSFENGTTGWGWYGGNFYSGTYAAQCGAYFGQLEITNGSSNAF
ncbi:MAG TPA: hypothetical protein PKL15_14980, partial [Saprospiraceae bacterium]|nr:hypothetical protein [Saprospiraceae bacterium]